MKAIQSDTPSEAIQFKRLWEARERFILPAGAPDKQAETVQRTNRRGLASSVRGISPLTTAIKPFMGVGSLGALADAGAAFGLCVRAARKVLARWGTTLRAECSASGGIT